MYWFIITRFLKSALGMAELDLLVEYVGEEEIWLGSSSPSSTVRFSYWNEYRQKYTVYSIQKICKGREREGERKTEKIDHFDEKKILFTFFHFSRWNFRKLWILIIGVSFARNLLTGPEREMGYLTCPKMWNIEKNHPFRVEKFILKKILQKNFINLFRIERN